MRNNIFVTQFTVSWKLITEIFMLYNRLVPDIRKYVLHFFLFDKSGEILNKAYFNFKFNLHFTFDKISWIAQYFY